MLYALHPRQQINMSSRVLLNDVFHIVRTKGFFEFPSCDHEFDATNGSDGVAVDELQLFQGPGLGVVILFCKTKFYVTLRLWLMAN